jgi:flavodoxin
MKIFIVYDSIFGNTATIAKAIAARLGTDHEVALATVQEARGHDLSGTDLLIVGSPTRGFQPTPGIAEYIAGLSEPAATLSAAVFDTRLDPETINPPPLRWVVEVGGYAASRMASALRHRGYVVRDELGAFLVGGTEGPLNPGELERAGDWAGGLLSVH